MATPLTSRDKLRKLAGPLLVSAALGGLLYVGGDTSQAIGLEAFRTTRLVLGFLLGMATILSLAVLVNRFLRYVVLEGWRRPLSAAPCRSFLSNSPPQSSIPSPSRPSPGWSSSRTSRCCWRRPACSVLYSAWRSAS